MSKEQGLLDFLTRQDELIRRQNTILKDILEQQKQLSGGFGQDQQIISDSPGDGDEDIVISPELPSPGEGVEGAPPPTSIDNASFIHIPNRSPGSDQRILLSNGTTTINLAQGEISFPDGSTEGLGNSISGIRTESLWSLFMWVDTDCTVRLERKGKDLGLPLFLEQNNYLVIERFPFRKIAIDPVQDFDVRVYGIASTFPEVIYNSVPTGTDYERSGTGFSTTDNYQTIKTFLAHSLDTKSLRVENTGGSNDAAVRFESRVSGDLTWHTDFELSSDVTADDAALGPGESFRQTWTNEYFRQMRIQVKSDSASNSTTIDWEGGGVS